MYGGTGDRGDTFSSMIAGENFCVGIRKGDILMNFGGFPADPGYSANG